jgi:predicted metalloprotease with PDZ domain
LSVRSTLVGALLIAIICLGTACGLRPDPPRVIYHVHVIEGDAPRVEVTVEMSGLPSRIGPLRLGMNSRYAFIMPEAALLTGEPRLSGAAGGSITLRPDGPFDWRADLDGARDLLLRYTVPLEHRDLPGVAGRDEYEQPFLAAKHGMLATGAIFIAPLNIGDFELGVRFETPTGWPILCPWEEIEPGLFSPESVAALREDLVAIGDWTLIETERGGCRVQIAVAPGQPRVEQVAAPFVAQIVEAELALFDMRPRARYLFLFHPGRPNFFAGSPKTGSMTLQLSADPRHPFSLADLSRLVAHEFHHTWVHGLYVPPDELRFFNEGFTDYYAHLVSARLGVIGWPLFAGDLAERMERLARNPLAGELSLADAGGPAFFEDRNANDLVYHGGLLLAALLDLEIRRRAPDHDLDRFMRDFNNDPRWGWERAPALTDLLAAVSRDTDAEFAARFEAWIRNPWQFDPVTAFGESGVSVERRQGAGGGIGFRLSGEAWREPARRE